MPVTRPQNNETLSAERKAELLEQAPIVLYTCAPDGKFPATHIGPNIQRQMGWEPDDFLHDPEFWANHIHPDDREQVFAGLAGLFDEGRHVHEYRFLHKDSTYRWMRDDLWVEYGDDGTPRQLVGYWMDISDQKQSEQRYRDLIEGSNLGVQIANRDGVRVFVNQAMAKIAGYDSAAEVLALPPGSLVAPYDRERVTRFRHGRFDHTENQQTYEFDCLRKDGTTVPLQAMTQIIEWDGREAIQRTFIDLTDRKRTEEQLRQAQKMEAVGQLTGGIAHDFNNLLTVVLGNLQLIEANVDGAAGRRVASALRAVQRGSNLTQKLLAFSRRQRLEPEPTDVNELVEGMRELLHRTLGEPIAIAANCAEGLPLAMVDAAQLENAVLNLALNARDAMVGGGRLAIETSRTTIDTKAAEMLGDVRPGNYILVSVSDSGTGMSAEIVDHAFEPFFTTKETGKGSGLGLSMVYGFAHQSGGHADIESAPGAGTTVRLYLPLSDANAVVEAVEPEAEAPRGSESILVVEDDPDVRAYVVVALRGLGYRVVEAADGPSAINLVEDSNDIDLLFTDVVLPGSMNGTTVAEAARRHIPGLKVVFTSGYTRDAVIDETLSDGGGLLLKPFTPATLAERIRDALDRDHRE